MFSLKSMTKLEDLTVTIQKGLCHKINQNLFSQLMVEFWFWIKNLGMDFDYKDVPSMEIKRNVLTVHTVKNKRCLRNI